MDSFKVKAGELETVEKEVVTEFGDNVLLQEIATGASLYIEVTRVIDSQREKDVTKRLKNLLKNQKYDPIPSLQYADAFPLKQEKNQASSLQYYLQ